jgi:hypothetical protein
MIVRRNSENRNGATIILTEEELEYLWHRLNNSDAYSWESYNLNHKVPNIDSYDFFCQLDRRYTPDDRQ